MRIVKPARARAALRGPLEPGLARIARRILEIGKIAVAEQCVDVKGRVALKDGLGFRQLRRLQ